MQLRKRFLLFCISGGLLLAGLLAAPVGYAVDTGDCDDRCESDEFCYGGNCYPLNLCGEPATCDYSGNTCDEVIGDSNASPGCTTYKTVRCECEDECTGGTCGNTTCKGYKHICTWREDCPRPTRPPNPTDRPTEPPTRPPGTPTPTQPPGTPTPTLPPGITPTNTPPPEGPQCDSPCLGEGECSADQTCYFWRCRNIECPDVGADEDCICPAPTATPTPTTPPVQPTATPTVPPEVPTNTPPPGAPTPTPEASCSCLSMSEDSTDLSRVKRGDVLNFTTEAYSPTPDTAEVLSMEYTVTHVGSGQVVATSGFVTAVKDRQENIDGVLVDVYKTEWSYTVKDTDPEGLYRAEAKINCGWKTTGLRVRGEVAGEKIGEIRGDKGDGGFNIFGFLRDIVNRLLGREEVGMRTQEEGPPFPTTIRPTGTSLQLGTFLPVPTLPPSGCTWVNYQIVPEK